MAAPDFAAPNLHVETMAPPRLARRPVSRRLIQSATFLAEAAADFLLCTLAVVAAEFLHSSMASPYGDRQAIAIGAAFGLIAVFLFYREGSYQKASGLLRIRETERSLRVLAQAGFLLLAIQMLLRPSILSHYSLTFSPSISLAGSLIVIAALPPFLILQKQVFFSIVRKLDFRGSAAERVVIYGADETARSVVSQLLQSPRLRLEPIAVVDSDPSLAGGFILEMGYCGRRSIPVRRGPISTALLLSLRCELLLIAAPDLDPEETASAARAAKRIGSEVAVLCGPALTFHPGSETIDVDGVLFFSSKESRSPWLYSLAKRIADLAASSALLVLLAPLFVLIAIIIRLESPGPALFVHKRSGRDGVLFDMYKFRSMRCRVPKYARSPASSSDPRITRVGRILRRLSLDELPQLINVLEGTMSLVGPRPEMPFIVESYDARQRQRLKVKPGITGLWQLSADRAFPIHSNIEYDLYYIRSRTFAMDIAILLHTLIFALHRGT